MLKLKTTSEFTKLKLDTNTKHEWFSPGPGGHIKGENVQSKGGGQPEEGGGETSNLQGCNRLLTLGERARED